MTAPPLVTRAPWHMSFAPPHRSFGPPLPHEEWGRGVARDRGRLSSPLLAGERWPEGPVRGRFRSVLLVYSPHRPSFSGLSRESTDRRHLGAAFGVHPPAVMPGPRSGTRHPEMGWPDNLALKPCTFPSLDSGSRFAVPE